VDGVLLLDKPSGISSNAALQRARRLYSAEKAGHTGTLDPAASGLLPVCFGEATKFAGYLLDAVKSYRATIRFGTTTTTGDADGEPTGTHSVTFDEPRLREALARFRGTISQVPPRHAALKFEGRAYYEYARAGVEIPRTARPVTIHALDLVEWSPPDAIVDVTCSKGTYVRVLAEDLGRELGCGAHLAALRRTATGGFDVGAAVTLDALEAMPQEARDARLAPPDVLVAGLARIDLDPGASERFRHGMAVPAQGGAPGACAVFCDGRLAGVADVEGGLARPRRLLATPPQSSADRPMSS
jgi:tRNA pseudouridine55 synthase